MDPLDITPEEKLLNLIKSGEANTQVSESSTENTGLNAHSVQSSGNLPQNTGAFHAAGNAVNALKRFLTLSPKINLPETATRVLTSLPNILAVVSLILVLALSTSIYYRFSADRTVTRLVLTAEKEGTKAVRAHMEQNTTPFEKYSDLHGKDIFKLGSAGGGAGAAASPSRGTALSYINQNYSLSGIIMGDRPQAVIEDKKQGNTHVLSKGESAGEITVGDIQKGKVIIIFRGEEVEINL